mgnify:CR=1 FL=1
MGRLMAIEGRKNAQDAKRGKVFTKLIRELSVAARAGGGDPKTNPRLGPGMMWQAAARRTQELGGQVLLGHTVTGLTSREDGVFVLVSQ